MIHILIRYLGIKTKLLNNIFEEIKSITPINGTVLDIFSGSTVVAQSLLKDYKVFANDIQEYSCCVGKSTIELDKNFNYNNLDLNKIIKSSYFCDNRSYLTQIFNNVLDYENNLLKSLSNKWDDIDLLTEFKLYYDKSPSTDNYNVKDIHPIFLNKQKYYKNDYYLNLKHNKNKEYYQLFTLNYSMPYFSISQAIFIDSYRYALDKMVNEKLLNEKEYNVYLSLLIYLLQNIVTSVGDHFAQPQQFKLLVESKFEKEIKKIINKKNLDIYDCLNKKLTEFRTINLNVFSTENKMFCMDYKELFNENNRQIMNKVDTIYIDPPYTNAHYSRFYHILETLVKYDYPDIKYFGRYRNDRYQSPFGIKTKAEQAFKELIDFCHTANKNIIISYSDTAQCIVPKEKIIDYCKLRYETSIKKVDYTYRNFGQKPNKVNGNELLITCKK